MRRTLPLTAGLAIVLAACGPGDRSSASNPVLPTASAPGDASGLETQSLIVRDFELDSTDETVDQGEQIAVKNEGPTIHNVTIRDEAGSVIAATKDLRTGESDTLSVDASPGRYIMYCSLPGHESLGIKGTLTVEAP